MVQTSSYRVFPLCVTDGYLWISCFFFIDCHHLAFMNMSVDPGESQPGHAAHKLAQHLWLEQLTPLNHNSARCTAKWLGPQSCSWNVNTITSRLTGRMAPGISQTRKAMLGKKVRWAWWMGISNQHHVLLPFESDSGLKCLPPTASELVIYEDLCDTPYIQTWSG